VYRGLKRESGGKHSFRRLEAVFDFEKAMV